ncbi:MAG: hypothetical protein BroJett042_23040 [Bacteroidota bacterium]|nr:MAG: hypothetical protein BroJett042_23040 [Bacteroidota bacterium]
MTAYDYPVIEETQRPVAVGKDAKFVSRNLHNSHMIFIGQSVFASQLYQNRLNRKFNLLKSVWENDTMFSSSITEITSHPAYHAVIKLGQEVLPLIIQDLQTTNNHWFYALEILTGENPIRPEHRGNVEQMKSDWVNWANRYNIA